jgi:predicted nucleic acid-binding protein
MSSMIRFALDSNILIYAEGGNDAHRRELAHQIIGAVVPNQILVPIQTASETMNWLIKKTRRGCRSTQSELVVRKISNSINQRRGF